MVNSIVDVKKFNKANNDFYDNYTFPAILNYVPYPIKTSTYQTKMNIFLLIPLDKHPDHAADELSKKTSSLTTTAQNVGTLYDIQSKDKIINIMSGLMNET